MEFPCPGREFRHLLLSWAYFGHYWDIFGMTASIVAKATPTEATTIVVVL